MKSSKWRWETLWIPAFPDATLNWIPALFLMHSH